MKPNRGDVLCENFWIGSRNQIPTISQLLWLGLLSYGTDSNTNSLYQSLFLKRMGFVVSSAFKGLKETHNYIVHD